SGDWQVRFFRKIAYGNYSKNSLRSEKMMVPSAGLLLCVAACCFLPLLTVSAGCRSKWKHLRGDITEYKLITVLKVPKITDCLMKSSAAEAHAASFDAESGDCALMQCARGGRDACRKCRHEKDASLPMLWIKDPPKTCWKTFQHRVDGSVSFNRNWSEYVSGFGQDESLNYWMGLEQLHQLTATGVWRVRWEFSDWNDNWYWAENAPFS
uniref:Fibrinogen C-terminal domain-containing protein n=1 Tax=Macrostomum lignano TaxID=282301 RepID=A0A1I8GE82_9PLAT